MDDRRSLLGSEAGASTPAPLAGASRPARRHWWTLMALTVGSWAVALAGGALVVSRAANAEIYRCADGFTNRGGLLWGHVIAALVLTSPALGGAGWLVAKREGGVWLRSAAVTVAIAVTTVTIALAVGVLLDAPATGRCLD